MAQELTDTTGGCKPILSSEAIETLAAGLTRQQISLLVAGRPMSTYKALRLPWRGLARRTDNYNRWVLTNLGVELSEYLRENMILPID